MAAYRQFIQWTYSRLGRGTRKVIPSFVVAAIHHDFPEGDGVYTVFKLAELYLTSTLFIPQNLFP